jgi:lipid-A-disaccharide synthase
MPTPLIFLVAGEPSGDALGARLMASLKEERGDDIAFAGVGGPEMEAEGLESLFPMGDLAIMGLFEVLPGLRKVLARLKETVSAVQMLSPDLVITIDAQGFSYRVAKRLMPAPCPVIHYVAPTVWAWKAWRARKVAQVVDRLLLLFPF